MPTDTGIWNQDEADQYHAFDYFLARWIGRYLPKDERLADLGCGKGTYLSYFDDIGFHKTMGVEGTQLSDFESGYVLVHDLTQPLKLPYKSNILCLEVAEHIPEEYLPVFMDNLVSNMDAGHKLILSWAIPGQEGIGHVSCRPNWEVIQEMEKRGLKYDHESTLFARANTSNHCAYFRDTLMIFHK